MIKNPTKLFLKQQISYLAEILFIGLGVEETHKFLCTEIVPTFELTAVDATAPPVGDCCPDGVGDEGLFFHG